MNIRSLLLFFTAMLLPFSAFAEEKTVTVEEFIKIASEKDTYFEQILIDEMKLKYKKEISSAAGDILLSVKGRYNFEIDASNPDSKEASVSLAKLFPCIGLEAGISYSLSDYPSVSGETSAFNASFSIPLAKNAFGYSSRMTNEIAGLEEEISSHQAVEAYEEYLSSLLKLYYTWYSNYAAMKAAEISFEESKNLLNNMQARRKSGIAYKIDVNKTRLQSIEKEETLITIKQSYIESLNLVKQAMRTDAAILPAKPGPYRAVDYGNTDINSLIENSRTFSILDLLVKKAGVSEGKAFNSLLPSADFTAGYSLSGSGFNLNGTEHAAFIGFELGLPIIAGQKEHAEHESAKLESKRQSLSKESSSGAFKTNLVNLFNELKGREKILKLAEEKEILANAVYKEEKEYYNQARSSLNDLISAINSLENAKFSRISEEIKLNILIVEWLRLTDTLITKTDIIK